MTTTRATLWRIGTDTGGLPIVVLYGDPLSAGRLNMTQTPPPLDRNILNTAVTDAWLDGLPAEFEPDWEYVTSLPGEHLPLADGSYEAVDGGRARMIIRNRHDGSFLALAYYEITGEADMYSDRFRGETPVFVPVEPYRRVTTSTDYRPVREEPYPLTGPISTHVHPHVD